MSGVRSASMAALALMVVGALPALAQSPPPPPPPQPPPECYPSCRSGFMCVQGACRSRCNPACPTGTECLDTGECAPIAPPPPTTSNQQSAPPPPPPPPPQQYQQPQYQPQPQYQQPPPQYPQQYPQQPYQPPPQYQPQPGYQPQYQPGYHPGPPSAVPSGVRVSLGWARGAGVLGLVSVGLSLVTTSIAIAISSSYYPLPGNVLAISTLTYLGIMIPVVAGGGGSARGDPEVSGSGALRAFGWIFYALTYGTAAVLAIAALVGAPIYSDLIGAVTFGAIASATFISIDCFVSAGHAASVNEQRGFTSKAPVVKHAPLFAIVPARNGGAPSVMAGWALAF